jgi:hypothetical protein
VIITSRRWSHIRSNRASLFSFLSVPNTLNLATPLELAQESRQCHGWYEVRGGATVGPPTQRYHFSCHCQPLTELPFSVALAVLCQGFTSITLLSQALTVTGDRISTLSRRRPITAAKYYSLHHIQPRPRSLSIQMLPESRDAGLPHSIMTRPDRF